MPQEIEMIRNAGRGHGKSFGNLSGRQVAFLKHFQDAAAGRVPQGFKQKIQLIYN